MKRFVGLLLVGLMFTSSAMGYECTGKVNLVVAAPSGVVTVYFGQINAVYLCSVSASYNGVAPDSCKAVFSLLTAAKLADKNVTFWFNDASNNCTNSAHPAWADLKGWYFGPSL